MWSELRKQVVIDKDGERFSKDEIALKYIFEEKQWLIASTIDQYSKSK
jgi:hypothetical protein